MSEIQLASCLALETDEQVGRPRDVQREAPSARLPPYRRRLALASIVAVGAVMALALAAAIASFLVPGSALGIDTAKTAAGVIFTTSYLALAVGKVPGLSIDRAGVALVGACLMVAAGVLTLDEAYKAVDFNTITLLLGIMIVVANLRLSGFFALANAWVIRHTHRPITLLVAITAVSGIFSAFL
jgi:di/tricarboxylate transporter